MFHLRRIFARILSQRSRRGFTLFETVIALSVASISVLGAYGLTLLVEKHYRGSNALATMHGEARIAVERMFMDLSETSNETVAYTWNAISFASARGADGEFQLKPYSYILKSHRPAWQKAIIYYILEDEEGNGKLYRAEVSKTDWSSNYEDLDEPALADLDGEFVADNVISMWFDHYPADSLDKAHILGVNLEFGSQPSEEGEASKLPQIYLTTRVSLMNRTR